MNRIPVSIALTLEFSTSVNVAEFWLGTQLLIEAGGRNRYQTLVKGLRKLVGRIQNVM
jgi:hypothetical protein